jgi:hypothetical protein
MIGEKDLKPTVTSNDLLSRPRRLRRTDALRRMVRETHLSPKISHPLFIGTAATSRTPSSRCRASTSGRSTACSRM